MFRLSRIRASIAIVPPAESDPASSGILPRPVGEDLSVSESHTQEG
ncbi:hypothetical protein HMPREF0972_00043 [Actinomyces sp. oral taxon 848 str. F0332]|nr:hypothetical protein HMPREF0972_00043 [Actinomyces sp. oral taxon 848 str. F0332]